MLPESECLKVVCEILDSIKLTDGFVVKINHRKILNGMFEICGVPSDKFKTICSSIDKLDKMPWDKVRQEMCVEKGLDQDVADKIGQFVVKSGDISLIEELNTSDFGQNSFSKEGLNDLRLIFQYAQAMEIDKFLRFDLSLARGLDYYTGLIYEVILKSDQNEVGSIAAGGRYDNLVSSLLDNPNFQVPCVGISIGIERILATIESSERSDIANETLVQCYVGSIGKGMAIERLKLLKMLWSAGLRAEHPLKEACKPLQVYQHCEKENIPYAVFFGAKEREKNVVQLRSIKDRTEETISMDELILTLKTKLNLKISDK
ncbi:Histidine--tRNA ligase, cytoplasmic, partial [Fragariocoptes setiger]